MPNNEAKVVEVEFPEYRTERMTEEEANFNGGCPLCKSKNIMYGDTDECGSVIYKKHTCNSCGASWVEHYMLRRIEIEKPKKDQ